MTGEHGAYGATLVGGRPVESGLALRCARLFIGSYTHAVLTVYDPARPWAPGTAPDSNPRDLGTMGEQQYRPWDMTVGSDGRVWAAAFFRIDPATNGVEQLADVGGVIGSSSAKPVLDHWHEVGVAA